MNIIIAGAGRVGHQLAKTLCVKHDVIIIDKNAEVLQVLSENIDLLTMCGDIENPQTYISLINKDFDVFIAVTDSDEANILSTLIAGDVINVKQKIIRLRNAYFAKSSIADKLGISDAVFPFSVTADSIAALLDFPKANNVKTFTFTPCKLISVFVKNSTLANQKIDSLFLKSIIIVGIERKKQFFIPRDDDSIEEDDLIYFFGESQEIKQMCEVLDTQMPQAIRKITILGASLLGIEIAKVLAKRDVQLKIIEKDTQLCHHAASILQERVSVINSHYMEQMIFEDEQIKHSDMIISTDAKDEQNIIRCLEAQESGVRKTVALNNNKEHYALMHNLGIVAARGPKVNAYYEILEKMGSSNVVFEKHYCGGRATIFMRKIFPYSILIGKKVKPYKNALRCYILRENKLAPFREKIILQQEDVIIVFLLAEEEEKAKRWIYAL